MKDSTKSNNYLYKLPKGKDRLKFHANMAGMGLSSGVVTGASVASMRAIRKAKKMKLDPKSDEFKRYYLRQVMKGSLIGGGLGSLTTTAIGLGVERHAKMHNKKVIYNLLTKSKK